MIKKTTLLFYLINITACLAQSGYYTPIDTANIDYRNNIKVLYTERAALTHAYLKTFPDKRLGKVVAESYDALNLEFITKVNNGLFIKAPFYDERIQFLFKQVVDANPQYATLSSTRILVSFANAPNAYAIGDGYVVVELPLLASLKQQEELAFILCHEIAHNLLNHPLGGLQEYAKLKSSAGIKKQTREIEKQKYNKTQIASGLYKEIVYNDRKKQRAIELQADSLGFILYRNAFAGREAAGLNVFYTLGNIDKEKDSLQEQDYEKLFSSAEQPFKKEWILADEIRAYKYDKTQKFWQVDSLKTHPDCVYRANWLKTTFGIREVEKEGENMVSADYQNVNMRARYDDILGLYMLKEYGKSLYQALLLFKNNPGDAYLKNMIYSNLIKIQEAQKNYTMNKHVETMNPRYSYSYNTFLSFLRQLRKSEIAKIINQYSIKA